MIDFNQTVEINKVYPGTFGGAVFTALILGDKKSISFRASNKILTKIPNTGEYWHVKGQYIITADYGQVIIVNSATLRPLPSSALVGRLLIKHPAFRGFFLGKKKVSKLISEIGEFSLVHLLNNNNYVAIGDCIAEVIAKQLCIRWNKLKEETEVATFFAEYGFDSILAAKIYKICKFNTVQRLKNNPYSLISLANINLKTLTQIDKAAFLLGIPRDDPRRMAGIIEYILYKKLDQGHTVCALEDVKFELKQLKLPEIPAPEECVIQALKSKSTCTLEKENQVYLQSIGAAYIEQSVAFQLNSMLSTPSPSKLSQIV